MTSNKIRYYIYDFSDYGGLKPIDLTKKEAKELKEDDFLVFETKEEAYKILKEKGYEIGIDY